MIRLQAGAYEIVDEYRNGWNVEAFKERYSDILDKYDFVVGDWGYSQLRLRGFYDNSNRRVPFEQRIDYLDEYLHEFCNFGCPYFVLRKVKGAQAQEDGEDVGEIIHVMTDQGSAASGRPDRYSRTERPARPSGAERKERHARPQRTNDRNEREPRQPGQKQGQGRPERSGKPPRGEQPKGERPKGDRPSKDRRGANQQRPNREKVSSNPVQGSREPRQ